MAGGNINYYKDFGKHFVSVLVYKNVHSSVFVLFFLNKSQELKTSQMPINHRMGKYTLVYSCNGILNSRKKERTYATNSIMVNLTNIMLRGKKFQK